MVVARERRGEVLTTVPEPEAPRRGRRHGSSPSRAGRHASARMPVGTLARGRHRLRRRVHGPARREHRLDGAAGPPRQPPRVDRGRRVGGARSTCSSWPAPSRRSGKVADRIGRKLLYTYGFGIFVVGSAACALAPSLGLLVAARFVQAIGAVMLQANSYALIRDVLPARGSAPGSGSRVRRRPSGSASDRCSAAHSPRSAAGG